MKKTTQIILALDVDNYQQAMHWVKLLYPKIRIFKVGLQLYTACGPKIIKGIRDIGAEVFLDLKFNDIPNTMAAAVKEALKYKVALLTVHTLSGPAALKEVAAISRGSRTRILGVTILTSICPHFLQDLEIGRTLPQEVLYLARMAKRCGLGGVVCSVQEAGAVRKIAGRKFIIVTPGVRPSGAASDDQRRTATVKDAVKAGADFIVVGRPILKAADPLKAAQEMVGECKN